VVALSYPFRHDANADLVGVYEKKHEARGYPCAKWNIPVFVSMDELVKAGPEVVSM